MMPLIAAPIIAEDTESAFKKAKEAMRRGADLVEFRIDYIKKQNLNLEGLIVPGIPCIVTNRHVKEGGKIKICEDERLSRLQKAIELGAEYIDIELNFFHKFDFKDKKTKLIVSYHNFNETPENLDRIYSKIASQKADIVKIATKANSYVDTGRMLNLIEMAEKPIIGICMGELGGVTRIFDKNYLTFAALSKKECSAPGQYTINELVRYFKASHRIKTEPPEH